MPNYAYRWEDGSVSVLSAKNRDEGRLTILDQFGDTLILTSHPIEVTDRPEHQARRRTRMVPGLR